MPRADRRHLPIPVLGIVRRFVAHALAVTVAVATLLPVASRSAESGADDFSSRIEPLLRDHCYECHSHAAGKTRGGLTLDSRGGWSTGGEHGPAIVPGQPDASLLVRAIRRLDPDLAMPPKRPLPTEAVEVLVDWVRRGAPDPRTASVPEDPRSIGWAFQPLVKPAVPANTASHPIDAFVLDALRSRGGSLAPEADRRTLLRRLAVDLTGLLPTPESVEAFVGDPDPSAFDREIERHLASPRYGERWARHWLDVVHFAETHGHDQDRPRESAWPYRDYVIDALNADKPYPRFVQEQIAADALFPDEPALTPALGFLAAGPWDESSLRDIRDDTLDREIGRYLDRDDIVANVMSTFAGVTVHCARCHDHKFDPISQQDYYALQAVFAGTEKAERLYDLDPEINRRRHHWMQLRIALDRGDDERVDQLLTPPIRAELATREAAARDDAASWLPLRPTSIRTAHGTALTRLDDDSLLAGAANPAEEIYTVEAPLPTATLRTLRLEVLTDDSLPKHGPGRAENGNLHLTEFRVFRVDPTMPDGSPASPESSPLVLTNARADFEQKEWGIARSIDGDPQTAWGLDPQEGQPHVALFDLASPLTATTGTVLRVVLEQTHGRHHTIGRFRLSVTANVSPDRPRPIPPAIAESLALPPERRSSAQANSLRGHFLRLLVDEALAALPEPRRVYAGASVFPPNAGQKPSSRPRPIRVLRRGEITQPREEARPGTLSSVKGPASRFDTSPQDGDDEAERRAALARWLTDPDNPLPWRTLVNRVWHYHFGRGIAATPNDLGRMGSPPSDPRLLDWLAATFRDDLGGSLKKLHALILSSATWRQQSADPNLAHPWQPIRRRLDAETFRDSVLLLAGRLDLEMGGPSIKQFAMSPGIHVTPNVNYAALDPDAPGFARRAIYRFLFRSLPDPLMDTLDCPPGDQSAPTRSESFTALQAFALLNHPFVLRQCDHWAARLASTSERPETQASEAVRLAFQRPADPAELRQLVEYADVHGVPNLCRVLLNSNEFHFVD